MALGHAVVAPGGRGCVTPDPRLSFASLVAMGVGAASLGSNIFVFAQTLAGPSVAGKWTGLQNMIGNLCGVVAGPLSGWIVDYTGRFWWAFVIALVLPVIGGISWVFAVGPVLTNRVVVALKQSHRCEHSGPSVASPQRAA